MLPNRQSTIRSMMEPILCTLPGYTGRSRRRTFGVAATQRYRRQVELADEAAIRKPRIELDPFGGNPPLPDYAADSCSMSQPGNTRTAG